MEQARDTRHRRIVATGGVLIIGALLAGGWYIKGTLVPADAPEGLTISPTECAPQWHGVAAGPGVLAVKNNSTKAAAVLLLDAQGRVATQIDTLAPQSTSYARYNLAAGNYQLKCVLSGGNSMTSRLAAVTGSARNAPAAVAPATDTELAPAAARYQSYVVGKLDVLTSQVAALNAALAAGDVAAARAAWLPAQLTWGEVGAAYSAFGQLGKQIDGLPQGLTGGVASPAWRGLHRIEYGLWHGQTPQSLVPFGALLTQDVRSLQLALPGPAGTADDVKSAAIAPADLPLRAHEILEDTQRDRMSGQSDFGSGTQYRQAVADVAATRVVLQLLTPALTARSSSVVPAANAALNTLDSTLATVGVTAPAAVPDAQRYAVNAALGNALEILADVPQLLEQTNAHDPAQPDIS